MHSDTFTIEVYDLSIALFVNQVEEKEKNTEDVKTKAEFSEKSKQTNMCWVFKEHLPQKL